MNRAGVVALSGNDEGEEDEGEEEYIEEGEESTISLRAVPPSASSLLKATPKKRKDETQNSIEIDLIKGERILKVEPEGEVEEAEAEAEAWVEGEEAIE